MVRYIERYFVRYRKRDGDIWERWVCERYSEEGGIVIDIERDIGSRYMIMR